MRCLQKWVHTIVSFNESVELHFGICKTCRLQGIASLAVGCAVSYIFNELKCKSILCFPDRDNEGARRVLEVCGFQCFGEIDQFYKAPQISGELRTVLKFGLQV
ncbi:GNAT family N-acetyltransferase [Marinomonas spartinae]|uniref:GNAT family N-acetyltransferase n=1 Tax=Marinomonas spartinae TaxID=1792290 RepID=UPI0009F53D44